MPKALKTFPKSNKSPNLVTLVMIQYRRPFIRLVSGQCCRKQPFHKLSHRDCPKCFTLTDTPKAIFPSIDIFRHFSIMWKLFYFDGESKKQKHYGEAHFVGNCSDAQQRLHRHKTCWTKVGMKPGTWALV